ncbi:hypothetical protein PsorP6_010894 [Peronosclerospora sorghi]|uniref:Uncharacterized protein n=1 Tax=Peronosclerospora sorghi TaxID=230839 RepID=A0ACC0VYR9_9STRA|nr:hypothetical protein PsorP6_010894 [Peronosclerospora sorghi]
MAANIITEHDDDENKPTRHITQDEDRCVPVEIAWLFQLLRQHRKGRIDVCRSTIDYKEECNDQLTLSRPVIESCKLITWREIMNNHKRVSNRISITLAEAIERYVNELLLLQHHHIAVL